MCIKASVSLPVFQSTSVPIVDLDDPCPFTPATRTYLFEICAGACNCQDPGPLLFVKRFKKKEKKQEGNEPAPLIPRVPRNRSLSSIRVFVSHKWRLGSLYRQKEWKRKKKNNTKISRDISFEISSHHCCLYGGNQIKRTSATSRAFLALDRRQRRITISATEPRLQSCCDLMLSAGNNGKQANEMSVTQCTQLKGINSEIARL